MPHIFVFTAGNPEARQHLVDSIQNSVDDEKVFDNFDEAYHEDLQDAIQVCRIYSCSPGEVTQTPELAVPSHFLEHALRLLSYF